MARQAAAEAAAPARRGLSPPEGASALAARLWRRRLRRSFFARDALDAAPALVGTYLVVGSPAHVRIARVVETEAYRGPSDAACHARVGLTRRTRTLFGPPGHAYVFLIYGMYDCFNVVCMAEGAGHAVLVRAVEPVAGLAQGARGDGPGRLTRALGLRRSDDGRPVDEPELFFAAPRPAEAQALCVATSARVNVAYAGAVAEEPWRFFDGQSSSVSKVPRRSLGLGRG